MQLKKAVRKLHLWMGLASGLILSIVGITGSLYVFEPELAAYLDRDLFKLQAEEQFLKDDVAIAEYAEQSLDKTIESIQWPKRGRETYVFKFFGDPDWYYLDQSTGDITRGGEALGNSFFGFILDLHTTLTLGETGRLITGIASLSFALLMLTTGLYLWYPSNKGRRRSSFKIKLDSSAKRLNYDLHNVTGFYFFLPLFLIGITGAAFYFKEEVQWAVNTITFSEPIAESVWEVKSKLPADGDKDLLTVEEGLREMDSHYPYMYKRNLWMTRKPGGTLSFAYQNNIDVYAGADTRIFLKADPYTGEILAESNPEKMPLGSALMAQWHLPLHFGEFGGLFTRILWFIAGLLPAFLTYTGFKIWWGKNRKKQRTQVNSSRKSPKPAAAI